MEETPLVPQRMEEDLSPKNTNTSPRVKVNISMHGEDNGMELAVNNKKGVTLYVRLDDTCFGHVQSKLRKRALDMSNLG